MGGRKKAKIARIIAKHIIISPIQYKLILRLLERVEVRKGF